MPDWRELSWRYAKASNVTEKILRAEWEIILTIFRFLLNKFYKGKKKEGGYKFVESLELGWNLCAIFKKTEIQQIKFWFSWIMSWIRNIRMGIWIILI